MREFKTQDAYRPTGDQPTAIATLAEGLNTRLLAAKSVRNGRNLGGIAGGEVVPFPQAEGETAL